MYACLNWMDKQVFIGMEQKMFLKHQLWVKCSAGYWVLERVLKCPTCPGLVNRNINNSKNYKCQSRMENSSVENTMARINTSPGREHKRWVLNGSRSLPSRETDFIQSLGFLVKEIFFFEAASNLFAKMLSHQAQHYISSHTGVLEWYLYKIFLNKACFSSWIASQVFHPGSQYYLAQYWAH